MLKIAKHRAPNKQKVLLLDKKIQEILLDHKKQKENLKRTK